MASDAYKLWDCAIREFSRPGMGTSADGFHIYIHSGAIIIMGVSDFLLE